MPGTHRPVPDRLACARLVVVGGGCCAAVLEAVHVSLAVDRLMENLIGMTHNLRGTRERLCTVVLCLFADQFVFLPLHLGGQ